MRSGRIAEFLLSCALPPDRAAAVTGDFLEEAAERGYIWFWSSVFRTVVTRIIADFAEHTRAVARVGLIGSLRINLVDMAVSAGVALFAALLRLGNIHPAGVFEGLLGLWMAWWYVRCGFWIAERAPDAAIASCISTALIGWVGLLAWTFSAHTHPRLDVAPYVFRDALTICGALWARYRYLRRMRGVAHGS
ncbi:MAG TPA: hypothetical protein VGM43_20205 [Bryobacteraceae bacterium]